MFSAKPAQFKLLDDGQIYYQPQESNPLPGHPVARIVKSSVALQPKVILTDGAFVADADKNAARDYLQSWLVSHIKNVLQPLVDLGENESVFGPVRGIAFQLHESMGIVPREHLEDLISGLDAAMRQDLRARKIRLGPVLVFIPALNKPGAVRLRAILWSLFRDRPLPAETPRDGIVSFRIEVQNADKGFYQAVGYPVYGSRAIRIDMLDRVINAIYESAKDGRFQAQHTMAEWLGCGIEELYEILSAMGHIKVQETLPDPENKEAPKSAGVKPELSWFYLKKGKAFEKPKLRETPKSTDRKKKSPNIKPGKLSHKETDPRIISAGPRSKPEDSPFAILGQLKSRAE